jgi:hypothetical protein
MQGLMMRYSFAAATIFDVFNVVADLAEGHCVASVCSRSIRGVQLVQLATNACFDCVMESMYGVDDELMLATVRELGPCASCDED